MWSRTPTRLVRKQEAPSAPDDLPSPRQFDGAPSPARAQAHRGSSDSRLAFLPAVRP